VYAVALFALGLLPDERASAVRLAGKVLGRTRSAA
jgi:hypothetical protein